MSYTHTKQRRSLTKRTRFVLVLFLLALLSVVSPDYDDLEPGKAIAQTPQKLETLAKVGVQGKDGSMMIGNNLHLQVTNQGQPNQKESEEAARLVQELKTGIARYAKVEDAIADDYFPFPPDPAGMRIVHYVNLVNSITENWGFNPENPGALLYERQPDDSLKLIGAMVTAPDDADPQELNSRVPLSVAQWHLHTNICVPDPFWDAEQWAIIDGKNPRFGPESVIATEEQCEAVKGEFWPKALSWMVHAYVFADNPDDVWNQMY